MFKKAESVNDMPPRTSGSAATTSSSETLRMRAGEIDLVACRGDRVVFVEVKAWSSFGASDLAAVVNDRKRSRIARAAAAFLAANPRYGRLRPRFDILLLRTGQAPLHLESAFGADGVPL